MFIGPGAIRLLPTAMAQECANLTDDEAVAHRQTASGAQPSLPQCTGRAIKVLRHVVENQELFRVSRREPEVGSSVGSVRRQQPSTKRVVIRARIRPDPAPKLIVRALLDVARREAEQRRRDAELDTPAQQ